MNEVLPIVGMHVNGTLDDTGCSQSFMSTSVSCFWQKKEMDVLMVDEIKCCGTKNVKLVGCNMNPIDVKVLVVNGNLFGFDLLSELNAMNELSDMQITELSNVYFLRDVQPNFGTEFN